MNDVPLLRIGDFSRASSLSVKALRAYHEAGLLVPAVVDPATGYRSYSVDQLTDAAVIRRLRDLDVPLAAIQAVLAARDPEVTAKVLAEHGAVLEDRIARIRSAVDELHAGVASPGYHTPVHEREEPARLVLTVGTIVSEETWVSRLAAARAALFSALDAAGAVADGPFGATYPPLLTDDAQEVEAFVPITAAVLVPARSRASGVRIGELPAGRVAVLAHRGSYDDLPGAYRLLGAWVATRARSLGLPVRELYVVGPDEDDDPARWHTELCWPVLGIANRA